MSAGKYEINMTEGSMTKNLLRFSLPLIASNMLQLLYNAADVIVVGKFAGTKDLAAVGATGSLINLLLNIFIGLSIGVSVLASHCYGSKDFKRFDRVVHTSITLSIAAGLLALLLGETATKPLLELMQTPSDVMPGAVLYVRIFFIGVPASLVYNFCGAIMRSVGDTKRPLYILSVSGIINIALNLVFVILFKMGVAGVAAATSVSNYVSAFLVLYCLKRDKSFFSLDFKRLKIHKGECRRIIRIGVPAGLQGMIFSFSNVIIQSAVNSFGSQVVAGSTASANIEGFVYMSMNAIYQAALTAVSQNYGAKNKKRIYSAYFISTAIVTAVGIIMGGLACIFREGLLSLYSNDAEVIECGKIRVIAICLPYFICGIMEVSVGFLRGVGYSLMPTAASFLGVCGVRLAWIYTVFAAHRSMFILYSAWSVS